MDNTSTTSITSITSITSTTPMTTPIMRPLSNDELVACVNGHVDQLSQLRKRQRREMEALCQTLHQELNPSVSVRRDQYQVVGIGLDYPFYKYEEQHLRYITIGKVHDLTYCNPRQSTPKISYTNKRIISIPYLREWVTMGEHKSELRKIAKFLKQVDWENPFHPYMTIEILEPEHDHDYDRDEVGIWTLPEFASDTDLPISYFHDVVEKYRYVFTEDEVDERLPKPSS